MEEITKLPDAPKMERKKFWKSLLGTILGITISIFLTFGTTALIQLRHMAKDRKITAMMVMGNIETFADNLEHCANRMGWNDTLATYLLSIPEDSLDLIDNNTLLPYINSVTSYYTLSHDKSAESIFSNSIDTWKNLGSFEFIENVGQCFADINSISDIYDEFFSTTDRIRERMMQNIDACPGNTLASKVLHDNEYRDHLMKIHSQADYYHYLSAFIRWKNTKNLELMGVTEEELKHFIEERSRQQKDTQPVPDQGEFRTPPISRDSLPVFKDWIE